VFAEIAAANPNVEIVIMMKRSIFYAAAVFMLGVSILPIHAADAPAQAALVCDTYPGLASDSLTYARLSDLPADLILRTGPLTISEKDLADEIAKAPQEIQPQIKNNAFFMLENMATRKVLAMLAKAKVPQPDKDAAAIGETELIQKYLTDIVAKTEVSDAEIAQFYADNKDAVGGATLDQVKDQIRQYLTQQKQQRVVDEHIRALGRTVPIDVSAAWTKQQAILARNNPVDKARHSGKPSLVDFGSTGCVPCDMLEPILETLKVKYAGKLNVVFVHVGEQQVLAARYGVKTIPTQFFYDKDGKEVFHHTGFWPQAEIEKKLAEMGVTQ
jgi:thioredoxin 1